MPFQFQNLQPAAILNTENHVTIVPPPPLPNIAQIPLYR